MLCEKCGNPMNDGAAFCPKCGHAVTKVTEETPNEPEKDGIDEAEQPNRTAEADGENKPGTVYSRIRKA